uniref:Uncharacterized protein n=1 Tax=Cyanophora sudae TaxID=1522369 RepID=A0A2Z4HG65_9EUKA|nr:hypothetical protein [Cyanophora sudae]AWW13738.1 hypothetical protein [Cyanophora sudae]
MCVYIYWYICMFLYIKLNQFNNIYTYNNKKYFKKQKNCYS